jgi:hypothetical protein
MDPGTRRDGVEIVEELDPERWIQVARFSRDLG